MLHPHAHQWASQAHPFLSARHGGVDGGDERRQRLVRRAQHCAAAGVEPPAPRVLCHGQPPLGCGVSCHLHSGLPLPAAQLQPAVVLTDLWYGGSGESSGGRRGRAPNGSEASQRAAGETRDQSRRKARCSTVRRSTRPQPLQRTCMRTAARSACCGYRWLSAWQMLRREGTEGAAGKAMRHARHERAAGGGSSSMAGCMLQMQQQQPLQYQQQKQLLRQMGWHLYVVVTTPAQSSCRFTPGTPPLSAAAKLNTCCITGGI